VVSTGLLNLLADLLLEVLLLNVGCRVLALKCAVTRVDKLRGSCWRKSFLIIYMTNSHIFSLHWHGAQIFKRCKISKACSVGCSVELGRILQAKNRLLVETRHVVKLEVDQAGATARHLLHKSRCEKRTFHFILLWARRQSDHWMSLEWPRGQRVGHQGLVVSKLIVGALSLEHTL
jgi:hypothetical protein